MTIPVALPGGCLDIPARLNITDHVVSRHVLMGQGSRAALDCDGDVVTFAELDGWTDQVAGGLQAAGIGRGERFVLWAPNSVWYVLSILGGMKAGAVPVLVPSHWSLKAVEAVVRRTRAKGVLVTPEFQLLERRPGLRTFDLAGGDRLDAGPRPVVGDTGADDIAYVTCVSDKGSDFRAVAYAHRVVIGAGDPIRYGLLRLTPDDICLVPGELSGDFALDFSVYLPLSAGAKTLVHRSRGPAEAKSVLTAVERNRVTILMGTPDLYRRILAVEADRPFDLGSLRLSLSMGDLPETLHDELRRRFGLEVFALAAQPETHVFAATPEGDVPPDTLGLPLPGRDIEILTEGGTPAADGQVGRLCFPSGDPALAAGYEGMDAEWRARHHDGWYRTNHFAYRDEHGILHRTLSTL